MESIKLFWSKINPVIPHLYFIGILIWMASQNSHPNGKNILVLLLPLIFQVIYRKKLGNIILGYLFLLVSLYMVLAYLSDATKIKDISASMEFLIYGGLLVIFSNVMSIRLIKIGVLSKNS